MQAECKILFQIPLIDQFSNLPCLTSQSSTILPAITLYQHIKPSSPFHDKLSQFLTVFIFSSAHKRSETFVSRIIVISRMCIILSSFEFFAMLLFSSNYRIWFESFSSSLASCLLPTNWTHEWLCKNIISANWPCRCERVEWTPVGKRWWKCFHPKIYGILRQPKLN
jgi:hypothetical protein